jgi:glycosyltransferase involved in cell wall biosynthesis
MTKKSVLFVPPDYHSSFALRNEFRKIGWRADVYVPAGFPTRFLFESDDVIRAKSFAQLSARWKYLFGAFNFVHFVWVSRKYRFQIHYGVLSQPQFIELPRFMKRILGEAFHPGIWILRLLRRRIIYLPSGCRDEELRSEFELLDNGAVCGNCGYSDRCQDTNIYPNLDRANKHARVSLGNGFLEPSYLDVKHTRHKSIDLDVWKPIPISGTDSDKKIRVLHSHALENRSAQKLNIKGSPIIVKAMRRIESELSNVEFVEVTGLSTQEMLSEQQKADIIVDQLRYGHWGSTGIEAMALGKVLVCYVRPTWKDNFLKNFPEYSDLPVVNANVDNFYEVMINLLSNDEMIRALKVRSRLFAEAHYDPSKNVHEIVKVLMAL